MRNVTRLKMGYYPLSEAEGVKLRSLLSFSEPASVIVPCVGQGTALQLVTSDAYYAEDFGVAGGLAPIRNYYLVHSQPTQAEIDTICNGKRPWRQ